MATHSLRNPAQSSRSLLGALPLSLLAAWACSGTTPADLEQSAPNRQGVVPEQHTASLVPFPGAGTSGAGEPLGSEVGPETAGDCVAVGSGVQAPGTDATTTCFFNATDASVPAAVIERVLEVADDRQWVHVRLTFNPDFVDNTYGVNAVGWGTGATQDTMPAAMMPTPSGKPKPAKGGGRGHTFTDLLRSDHAELQLFNEAGDLAVHFKLDYISEVAAAPSGYASAGVSGGDGELFVGRPEWILGATTSLERNLNGCGFASYVIDSPPTDETFAPSVEAPEWDYRVVYEIWIDQAAFAGDAFGEVALEFVHASPSKSEQDTQTVTPGPCTPPPPDTPPPPSDTSGGSGGAGGDTPELPAGGASGEEPVIIR